MRPKPEVEKTTVSMRATPELRRAIVAAAAKERRPVAHWLEYLVEDELTRRGLYKQTGGPLARAPLPQKGA